MRRLAAAALALLSTALLEACAGGALAPQPQNRLAPQSALGAKRTPIEHVVLVIQENRTLNDFFAGYPGAHGTKVGKIAKSSDCHVPADGTIELKERRLGLEHDLDHTYQGYVIARAGGAMNGFDKVLFGNGVPECGYPYQYTNPAQIKPYWDMARQYVLAARMFTTQGSSSFTAHQDLIAGGTTIAPDEALINDPGCSGTSCIWGCDAPPKTRTSLVTRNGELRAGQGPFPCLKYPTLRDRLDAKRVSWKYYVPKMCCTVFGKLMSAFDAIRAVRYGPQWKDGHISRPQTNIFKDVAKGTLPAVSWVIPEEPDSDHPGIKSDTGPSWVASIVNAIGESAYWDSTAIVIVWDDWGGLYDNLDPPQVGYGGLGFRVPALVVSPYAKKGHVSQTQYEFGSILKYVEKNWDLGSLGTSDRRARSIIDCFDYGQAPRPFRHVAAKYPASYFIAEPPSNLPVDDDL